MSFVIAEPCIDVMDQACIRVCPVACIHGDAGKDRKLYIDYARDEELQSFHSRIAQYYSVQPWPEFRGSLPERATIADAQALAFQMRNDS